MKTLRVEQDGNVAVVHFCRPEVRNALNREMVNELHSVLVQLAHNAELKCLLFTGGTGKAFISGADIGELRHRKASDALLRINTGLFRVLEQFPIPTIAVVEGYALGGGCEFAMACDLRVAGASARFGQPEVGLGILPGAGGTYRLTRLVGLGKAKELVYTGRIIPADEALKIGLVNHVVESGTALERGLQLAEEIAKNSRIAVQFSKLALNAAHEMSSDVGMLVEATAQAVLFEDEEKQTRMQAFLDRKKSPKNGG